MSNQRQIIGNGGHRPEVHTRSLTLPTQLGEGGFGNYPGLGGGGFPAPFEGGGGGLFGGGAPGGNAGGFFGGGAPVGNPGGGFFGGGPPAVGSGGGGGGNFLSNLLGGGGGGAAGGSSNPLSSLNLKQISGFVERMGGIDGIIGSMGKVQKFMSTFQQMAPMVKTLFSSLGKGKVASEDVEVFKPKRKRRKKSSTGRRRTGGSKGRIGGSTKRKRK
ncbi:aminotransferase [Paenibacillus sp. HWE-109]|uniref:aminotransferase n=1 Tax=Paenibacillus sp. HWE-109 TaxID=1306526 RepID=UPI001EDD1225|nr:aminotransferase [Paenibacillus sp. HWE-109]UKS26588.1 aminotransferase [Paenibacillus sp. HWE-109]